MKSWFMLKDVFEANQTACNISEYSRHAACDKKVFKRKGLQPTSRRDAGRRGDGGTPSLLFLLLLGISGSESHSLSSGSTSATILGF